MLGAIAGTLPQSCTAFGTTASAGRASGVELQWLVGTVDVRATLSGVLGSRYSQQFIARET